MDLQQANRYQYAGANPVDFTDPTGLGILDVVGGATCTTAGADDELDKQTDTSLICRETSFC